MSKLLSSLEERLAVETNEYLRAELLAKKAAYLARTGVFEDARAVIASVRSQFGDGRSGRVTVLLMLAEGLLLHFESLNVGALDRLMRAQVLAQAGRDQELIALTSAWKGYLEFEKSAFDSAARSIALASTTASDDDHATRSRVASVLFTAFALCGDTSTAQTYFLSGREHAVKHGDQAALDALLHNKAVFGAARLRASNCVEPIKGEALAFARTEVNSAKNLQQLARIKSLATYIELAEARLSILERRFDYALGRLEQLQGTGPFPKGHFGVDLGLIEQAYCLGQLGKIDEALERSEHSRDKDLSDFDVDDRLVAAWQLDALADMDERFGSKAVRAANLREARDAYLSMTAQVSTAFAAFGKV